MKLDNADVERVYDFLAERKQVGAMLHISESGRPALEAVVKELERRYANQQSFPFNVESNRQKVGLLISEILEDYGYTAVREKALGQNSGAVFFKSAHTYSHK